MFHLVSEQQNEKQNKQKNEGLWDFEQVHGL